jgi:cellulose synthase/poly-beta-1,6-N-acetylglucosamine synthase-like glycosyltransferase
MWVVAAACLGVVAYTYVGYPIVIALLARLFPQRGIRQDPSFEPTVTVCMAVHDGAAFLEPKLRSLLSQDYPRDKLEVLIYSDGSTDQTEAIAADWAARDGRVRLLRAPVRSGKPTALNHMRGQARGEVLLLTDVRQPLAPGAMRALVARLADPRVGCVSGNLVLAGSTGSGAYWRYEKLIRRAEARFRSVVGISGSIAAVRRADLPALPPGLILDDVWIPMRLRLAGRLVLFEEAAEAYDVAFDDEREFGRKARTLAGNYQLFAWAPALLSPLANPSWFETVSHKLLRLLCPWALLVLLFAAAAAAAGPTPAPVRGAAGALLGGQALFYLGAVLGPHAGRLGSLCRTFVVLNAAAVVGLWRFLTGGQRVTW